MTIALIAVWVLVGWCGTPWPRPWPFPDPPDPVRPDPDPWLTKAVGVVGGLLGGLVYNQLWPASGVGTDVDIPMTGIEVAATAIGAYVGSILLVNVYGVIRSRAGSQSMP